MECDAVIVAALHELAEVVASLVSELGAKRRKYPPTLGAWLT